MSKIPKEWLYKPKAAKTEASEQWLLQHETNFDMLADIDQQAKVKGTILGRYIREPFADGAAIYQVIEDLKSHVIIKWVNAIGDDWMIPYWGKEAKIKKTYATENIRRREALAQLFGKK